MTSPKPSSSPPDVTSPPLVPRITDWRIGGLIVLVAGIAFWLTVNLDSFHMRVLQIGHIVAYWCIIATLNKHRQVMFLLILAVTLSGWILGVTQEPFIVAAWSLYGVTFLSGTRRHFTPMSSIVLALLTIFLLGGQAPSSKALVFQMLMSLTLLLGSWALGIQGRAEADQREQAARARERTRILEERAKVSRDLHDVLSHTLSRIGLQAGVAAETSSANPRKTIQTLRSIESTSRSALNEVRGVLATIRTEGCEPTKRTTLSDIATLVHQSGASGIHVAADINLPGPPETLVNHHLYRIIQELLTNIGKHATSSSGELLVQSRGSTIRICSRNHYDSGSAHPKEGLGLTGVRERAALLNGTCEVSATEGTFVAEVTLPTSAVGAKAGGEIP